MPVPDFQSFMLPLLKFAADHEEHTKSDASDALALHFNIVDADRKEMLPSGRQTRFNNRIAWAIVYLRKAKFLESTRRGRFKITDRGFEILKSNPPRIDAKYLMQHGDAEFKEFHQPSRRNGNQSEEHDDADAEVVRTPREVMDAGYQEMRRDLSQELLTRVKSCQPQFFEQLVVDLLVAMGYGGSLKDAGEAVGQSGDGGVDGIIKEDKLGLEAIYLQAKRWENTVGRPVVQAFAGSLDGYRAKKGVLITTSQFSPEAKDYVSRIEKKIVLIDGEELAKLMIDYGIGVATDAVYEIKRLDMDYFEGEL
ncbi:MAG: Restriction endonuclease [Methanosaeta sp. PtaU1.Bin112]|nr:MAG: Restriction endonuclease [Methanosaeta sp. PtaU1.Bin112]